MAMRSGSTPQTALLAVALAGLAAGGALTAAGQNGAGDVVWAATTVAGIGPALFWVASAARERRLGVDLIAVLALPARSPWTSPSPARSSR